MASYYKNAKVDLTTTGITTLYTAAAGSTAIFNSILVADDSGSTSTITITLTVTIINFKISRHSC